VISTFAIFRKILERVCWSGSILSAVECLMKKTSKTRNYVTTNDAIIFILN